jgi:holliday junction DNA helicase RuvB
MIYSALEDFRMDIVIGTGPGARTVAMDIKRFTAIGATTRQGIISAPLRGRFGLVLRLNPYDVEELTGIVHRSARLLEIQIDAAGAEEIARRSRGTPRIANRLLRRVRDYAQVRAAGHIDLDVALKALDLLEVDRHGLDEIDQKIMLTVLEKYGGGPVGLGTISAAIDEEPGTIEEVYEPYLIQLGFLDRTPRGRIGTESAFEYFGVARRMRSSQQELAFRNQIVQSLPHPTRDLAEAFGRLRLPPTASLAEAEAAYLDAAAKSNPDQVSEMDPAFHELAKQETQKLDAAIDQIRRAMNYSKEK